MDTQRSMNSINGILRVREAARKDRTLRFNNLMHHITVELLESSYQKMNPKAAPGVDKVTWEAYGQGLGERLKELHEQVQGGRYRAQPSKRLYIPKADGRKRPIGIAAMEDKIVQHAVMTVLNAIYEEDFLGFSYGFRPQRGQHQALDALYVALTERRVEWILDADIRGFFDNLAHSWVQKFLEERVGDHRIQRLIAKWLKAGVSEDGEWSKTEKGTPQGAVISPLLANVYLHYVLDQWVVKWRKEKASGEVYIVRFADDFVMGFQFREDAERMLEDLRARLGEYELELNQEKTRVIEFGRHAEQQRKARGEGKPETFDFLGFTHICARRRKDGEFTVWRKTIGKRLRKKVQEIYGTLKANRHEPVEKMGRWLGMVLSGYYNYFAVPNNWHSLDHLRWQTGKAWYMALRRRSQKADNLTWAEMETLIKTWLPKPRIIHPWPNVRFRQRFTLLTPKARAV